MNHIVHYTSLYSIVSVANIIDSIVSVSNIIQMSDIVNCTLLLLLPASFKWMILPYRLCYSLYSITHVVHCTSLLLSPYCLCLQYHSIASVDNIVHLIIFYCYSTVLLLTSLMLFIIFYCFCYWKLCSLYSNEWWLAMLIIFYCFCRQHHPFEWC